MKNLVAAMLCLFIGLTVAGCQYHRVAPRVDDGPYAGPRVSVDSWGLRHRVLMTVPTGGWTIERDQSRAADGRREVFISAERPPRDQMVGQALAPHEVDSGVDSRIPLDVYVRIVEAGADPADFPYRRAARSDHR